MNVSAVIVTRGDCDLSPVLDSLPRDWQKVVWDNSVREDLAVYGRYAAIEECEHDVIYVQDDDCVLAPSSLEDLVDQWLVPSWGGRDYVVCNQPAVFRHEFYADHALVGFGAIFHRDLPSQAFDRYMRWDAEAHHRPWVHEGGFFGGVDPYFQHEFNRTCDIVFTALTPRILVDLPYRDLPHAHADNRMWKQKQHVEERTRMLEIVRQVRDA